MRKHLRSGDGSCLMQHVELPSTATRSVGGPNDAVIDTLNAAQHQVGGDLRRVLALDGVGGVVPRRARAGPRQ
jgi:hypothetical protein